MSNDLYKRIQAQSQGNGVAAATPTHFDMISAMIGGGKVTQAQAALIEQVLVRGDDGSLMFDDVKLSPVGLVIPPDGINQSTATGLLDFLFQLEGSIGWMIGDILSYGEKRAWGSFYDAAMQKYSREYDTLADYVYVASNVQFSVRTEKLTFTHHKVVAAMDRDGQLLWLDYAARLGWKVAKLKAYLAPLRGASVDIQRQWLEVVERDGLTPQQLSEGVRIASIPLLKNGEKDYDKIREQEVFDAVAALRGVSNKIKKMTREERFEAAAKATKAKAYFEELAQQLYAMKDGNAE